MGGPVLEGLAVTVGLGEFTGPNVGGTVPGEGGYDGMLSDVK